MRSPFIGLNVFATGCLKKCSLEDFLTFVMCITKVAGAVILALVAAWDLGTFRDIGVLKGTGD